MRSDGLPITSCSIVVMGKLWRIGSVFGVQLAGSSKSKGYIIACDRAIGWYDVSTAEDASYHSHL